MRHSDRRAAGVVITHDFNGRESMRDTQQCVHCGAHWVVEPGSGKKHAWCLKCAGNTCSSPRCRTICYPEAKRHDDMARHGRLCWPD